jgi:exodeoxyribonuclease VII large subunit
LNRSNQILNQTTWQLDHLIKSSITDRKYALNRNEESLHRDTRQLVLLKSNEIKEMAGLISTGLRIIIPLKLNHLNNSISSAGHLIRKRLVNETFSLELATQKAYLTDPKHVLARGYSITTHNGKVLKNSSHVDIDDAIQTTLYEGVLISKVFIKNKTDNQ